MHSCAKFLTVHLWIYVECLLASIEPTFNHFELSLILGHTLGPVGGSISIVERGWGLISLSEVLLPLFITQISTSFL